MAKGYWIPQIDVSNPEGYKAYMAATPPAHEKYHGVALVRGGRMEVVEGRARGRCVLREFPDYAAALACYRSEHYQRARPLRLPHFAMRTCVNTPNATGTVQIYDNTAGSGNKIGLITEYSATPHCFTFDVAFWTGLTVVTATAAGDLTVSFR